LTIASVLASESAYSLIPPQLVVRRIELYFDNNRPEITIDKSYQRLKAYAKITFQYAGLLEGYWEVDGRIISRVSEHLTTGNTVILETPEVPPLPTFDPGTHVVKFIVTNPADKTFPLPSMLYFVTAQGSTNPQTALKLLSPVDKAFLKYGPPIFSWEKLGAKATYTVQFYRDPASTPFFSALTTDTSYTLPYAVLRDVFKPGVKYYWRVKGGEDRVEGESPLREFRFRRSK